MKWIIYDKPRLRVNTVFATRLKDYIDAEVVLVEDVREKILNGDILLPQKAIMRCYVPDFTALLEKRGVRVYNNSHISLVGNDKWEGYLFAKEVGVPFMPAKLYAGESIDAEFPIVLKSRYGHGGSEVFWIDNSEQLRKVFSSLSQPDAVIQQPADKGKDLRLYVLGGKVISRVLRTSSVDFRSNFSLGGNVQLFDSDCFDTFALKMGKDIDFGAVDLVFEKGEPRFNEIEDIAGSRMVYECGGADMIRLFADYILHSND